MMNTSKKIYPIIIEIILLLAFIVVTYFIWNNSHMESYSKIAQSYANFNTVDYEIEGKWHTETLIPISNKEAKKQEPGILKLKSIGTVTNTTIALQIAKTSSLDYHDLNILFDHEVIALKNCSLFEDADYYYVAIYQGEITNEVTEHSIYLYLDKSAGNDTQNKTIALDIVSIENEMI